MKTAPSQQENREQPGCSWGSLLQSNGTWSGTQNGSNQKRQKRQQPETTAAQAAAAQAAAAQSVAAQTAANSQQ